mmetsp:Transcript_158098/g.507261  ORF Transcript_158098/g.507261 Transcript_158098/m.507261 type:complete len:310 (-) Transcript_158098:25-954(-)
MHSRCLAPPLSCSAACLAPCSVLPCGGVGAARPCVRGRPEARRRRRPIVAVGRLGGRPVASHRHRARAARGPDRLSCRGPVQPLHLRHERRRLGPAQPALVDGPVPSGRAMVRLEGVVHTPVLNPRLALLQEVGPHLEVVVLLDLDNLRDHMLVKAVAGSRDDFFDRHIHDDVHGSSLVVHVRNPLDSGHGVRPLLHAAVDHLLLDFDDCLLHLLILFDGNDPLACDGVLLDALDVLLPHHRYLHDLLNWHEHAPLDGLDMHCAGAREGRAVPMLVLRMHGLPQQSSDLTRMRTPCFGHALEGLGAEAE